MCILAAILIWNSPDLAEPLTFITARAMGSHVGSRGPGGNAIGAVSEPKPGSWSTALTAVAQMWPYHWVGSVGCHGFAAVLCS